MFAGYQLSRFRDFRTWALDSRGHGQSRSKDSSLSIGQFADDVIRFCAKAGIRTASVIGYSDGGNIAIFLAARAPELFPRIVAVSPNYLVSGTTEEGLRIFRAMRKTAVLLGRLGFDTRKQVMRCDLMLRDIGISEEELRGIRTRMKILYAEKDLIKEDPHPPSNRAHSGIEFIEDSALHPPVHLRTGGGGGGDAGFLLDRR
jgi:hypothetical protein